MELLPGCADTNWQATSHGANVDEAVTAVRKESGIIMVLKALV